MDNLNQVLSQLSPELASTLMLLLRFGFNFFVAYLIVNRIYFKSSQNKEYFFTFYVFNVLIFFICYVMQSINASVGLGMGLFAIFSIIRYRTGSIPTKEMTYLFILIALGLVNSLVSNYFQMLFVNIVVVSIPYYLEKNWREFQESSKTLLYEKIELIKPQHYQALLEDIKERTGINIHRVEVQKIDFLRDTAQLKIYYMSRQSANSNDSEANQDD